MVHLTASEQAQNLIEQVFSGIEGGGYIAIVEVNSIDNTDNGKWIGKRFVYYAVRPDAIPQLPDLNPDSAWFFSPVIYSTQSTLKTQVVEGSTLWLDLDDEDIDPFSITPRPSAVVRSSKGRYHVFWFLRQSISVVNLEHFNRRLAYAIGADKSGWDANQLLRLPAGLNLKREPYEPIELIHLDKELKYDLDMFAMLPDVPPNKALVTDEPLPLDSQLLSNQFLLDKYGTKISAGLKDILKRKQADRSRALWRVYNECARMGMPASECYALVKGSPNDKFSSDLRYLASESLWRDILAGYAQAAQGQTDRGIIDQMDSIRMNKLPQQIKLTKLGKILIDDLRKSGMFYQTRDGGELFYLNLTADRGELIRVEVKSQKLRKLMLDVYAVNPGTEEYVQLFECIASRCQDDEPVEVYRFSHYDSNNGVLYVNKYDNYVLRITASGYEIVPNGADGVLFLNPTGVVPYLPARKPNYNGYAEHTGRAKLWSDLVLSCANLTPTDDIEDEQIRHILYSWVLSLFFNELFRVKPILLIHGERGSGKTMLFKAIMNVLLAPGSQPDAPYANPDAFDNAVTNKNWLCVDNVDEHHPWLANKLALVATGYNVVKRKLYTNNDSFVVTASCSVGITSRDPKFLQKRDDVAERIIPVRVEPYRDRMVNEDSLIQDIIKHRAFLWGELIEDLIAIITELKQYGGRLPKYVGDFRQADFAAFLSVTATLKGTDLNTLLKHIKKLQGVEALNDDPFVYVLSQWLQKDKNKDREISPALLHIELQSESGGNEFLRRIPSGRGLAINLSRYQEYLSSIGIIVTRHGTVSPTYSFNIE